MELHIDTATTIKLLRKAVAARGEDFVYGVDEETGCYYADSVDGVLVPSCIVGYVLHYLGLLGLVFHGSNTDACATVFGPLEEHGVTFDGEARSLLIIAQGEQDAGTTWGLSVTRAIEETQNDALKRLDRHERLERENLERRFREARAELKASPLFRA